MAQPFEQRVPHVDLSVEKGTPAVPNDGRYHVLHHGKIVFSARSKAASLDHYRALRTQLLAESGWRAPQRDPAKALRAERAFGDILAVRGEATRRRVSHEQERGGKGGRSGV